jgi:hypothetical protein
MQLLCTDILFTLYGCNCFCRALPKLLPYIDIMGFLNIATVCDIDTECGDHPVQDGCHIVCNWVILFTEAIASRLFTHIWKLKTYINWN